MKTQQSNTAIAFKSISLLLTMHSGASWAFTPVNAIGDTIFKRNESQIESALSTLRADPTVSINLNKPGHALKLLKRQSDLDMETYKFQEYYKGVQVLGAQAMVHKTRNGQTTTSSLADWDVDTTPTLTADEAIAIARNSTGKENALASPVLKILPNADENSARLTYWVRLSSDTSNHPTELSFGSNVQVIIDAHSGQIIAETLDYIPFKAEFDTEVSDHNHFMEGERSELRRTSVPTPTSTPNPNEPNGKTATIEVFLVTDDCQTLDPESGAPIDLEYSKCKRVINGRKIDTMDRGALQAATNSTSTYNYYLNTHGRNSFDNLASNIKSFVHVGKKFSNAFWDSNSSVMAYGDGDGVEMGDFTRAVDVAGHEMTHGVVSKTADLQYFDESGALNEAYADFFGKMIEQKESWILGKELYLDPKKAEGIRDISDPARLTVKFRDDNGVVQKKPYPSKLSEKFVTKKACARGVNDNCWVHVNSTIASHGAYLVSNAIGIPSAQKLYYVVLAHYLTPSSTLKQSGKLTRSACKTIFDKGTCALVDNALAKAEL